MKRLLPLLLALAVPAAAQQRPPVSIVVDTPSPQASFGAEGIYEALVRRGHEVTASAADRVVVSVCSATDQQCARLRPEGFAIRVSRTPAGTDYRVTGADAAGAMYGALELAELVRIEGLDAVRNDEQSPYMAVRGTKFNIPLDVRTPSYSDLSDAAQQNMPEMWDFEFWKGYIDALARARYNLISLWSLHPFPSMVKVPEYPDVALDDVLRSTTDWEEYYSTRGLGFDAPEIVGQVEVLRRMTIDEKIDFWRRVMAYGQERNVDFYIITWNVFVNGTGGRYGITDAIQNPTTTDYFRRSVRQLFLTYPDLKGIGLTTGENMPGASNEEKERWAWETYGRGVLDAVAAQPGRRITFVHRQHQTGADLIKRQFRPLIEHPDIDFLFSFKYAQAHVFSSTRQTFHERFLADIGDAETLWTLRNDDNYIFRWGAPGFVREFILNIPSEVTRGMYYGSDQWVWGREFLSLHPRAPRELELEKHWYHWTSWGRLAYDPHLPDERFRGLLRSRFPGVDAEKLFTAWQQASLIYPVTTGFHWGALDFQWYIEACRSRPTPAQTPSGFHDVNRFISLPPHPGTDNVSIPDYVLAVVDGRDVSGTLPLDVSLQLLEHADSALTLIDELGEPRGRELRLTLDDIRTMAYLGRYYSFKIRGATELALFRATGELSHQKASVDALEQAAAEAVRYVTQVVQNYATPIWMNRVGIVDFEDFLKGAYYDVTIAGGQPRPIPAVPGLGEAPDHTR